MEEKPKVRGLKYYLEAFIMFHDKYGKTFEDNKFLKIFFDLIKFLIIIGIGTVILTTLWVILSGLFWLLKVPSYQWIALCVILFPILVFVLAQPIKRFINKGNG